jgi:single-stranded-DNA-specific exonuclease
MPVSNFDAFNEAVIEAVARQGLSLPHAPVIQIHAWLPEQAQRLDVARILGVLEPFGHDNAQPVFGVENARLLRYVTMGREQQHLKLTVGTSGREMEAVLWQGASRSQELTLARQVDLVGTLGINSWNGMERLQLVLKDFRRSD